MTRSFGRSALAALILSSGLAAPASAQLRVCAWNISGYGAAGARDPAFKTAIYGSFAGRSLSPDVVIVQELTSGAGATAFLAVLNDTTAGSPGDWALATFVDGPDTDLGFYYRTSKVTFLNQTLVLAGGDVNGAPRDIRRYDVRLVGYTTAGATLALYGDHMKAGSTCCGVGTDQARRLIEATAMRGNANALPTGWHFIFGGDTNIQSSTQDAFQEFVAAAPPSLATPSNTRGQFFDPIKTPGSWNTNANFKFVHTQAPGTAGQAAGMDDRFDVLLIDAGLIDGKGFEYIGNANIAYSTTTWNDPNHTFRAWGNDGTSYDTSLTVTNNQMVGAVIAQALVDSCATDSSGGHLPVFLDLRVPPVVGAPASINLGTITQNALGQTVLPVSNGGNVSLWMTAGISNLQYTLAGSAGVTAPAGTFNAGAGAPGNNHTVTINTSVLGPFNGTVTVQPTDGDTAAFPVAIQATIVAAATCYANCDSSTAAPVLNVADFTCFLQKYANGDPYANCDGSTSPPTLNVADFTCFLQSYANGCR